MEKMKNVIMFLVKIKKKNLKEGEVELQVDAPNAGATMADISEEKIEEEQLDEEEVDETVRDLDRKTRICYPS